MVSAHNSVGESQNSSSALLVASQLPDQPSQPRLLNSTSTSTEITWDPPKDNGGEIITAYEVHHKLATEPESAWRVVATITNINQLTYTHTGLSSLYDVQYKIRA